MLRAVFWVLLGSFGFPVRFCGCSLGFCENSGFCGCPLVFLDFLWGFSVLLGVLWELLGTLWVLLGFLWVLLGFFALLWGIVGAS